MTKLIVDFFASILDRRTLWRLSRALYAKARADMPNSMEVNGENMLQHQLLSKFAKNNEKLIVFDVGANIGSWTLYLLEESSKLGMASPLKLEVHAFEPVPFTFQTLQSRISQHPLGNLVHVVSQALSSEEGIAEIFIVGENAGTNSLYIDAMNKNTSQIQIRKTTVDAYCVRNDIKIVHFLKCDTEGHDMEVLYGARRLFEEQKVMVCQFEYNHRWIYSRHYLKDVFDYANNIPYSIGKVTPSGIEIYEEWHPELERFFEGNYILIHDNALCWFPIQKGSFDIYNTYSVYSPV